MSTRRRVGRSLESTPQKKVKGGPDYSINEDIANLLRIDSINAVHVSKSGHPTSCSSIAEIMSVLFFNENGLKFHCNNTKHFLNDRLVLSKGHAAPILYAALYRAKVLTEQQFMSLRVKDSIVEGHPVPKVPFVDVATGSLGQGLSVAAGMAYSSKYYDKIDNRIYCITGDGEMAEGNIWEAISFAQYYKLNNLTLFMDMNRLGQSQATMYEHKTDVFLKKLTSFGWSAQAINGHSIKDIIGALDKCKKQTIKPSIIICKTFKGHNMGQEIEDKLNWHGKDLGDKITQSIGGIKQLIKNQNIQFITYPPKGQQIKIEKKKISIIPNYQKNTKTSTRHAYGQALKKARESNKNVIGLDGDTKNSTFSITLMDKYPQNFIQCFIAEQNLIGVAIGLSCRGKIPFCSTFGAFLLRAADQIRIAGIGGNTIKLVGSHSGCSIGEDGPSQMSLEDLGLFRNIPQGVVLVPSDGVSAEKAVQLAGNYEEGPAYIRVTRPDLPIIYPNNQQFQLGKCNRDLIVGKVLKSSKEDKVVLISFGVTTHGCLKAYESLVGQNILVRVIDIFSLKPLDKEGLKTNIEQCGGVVIVVQDHYQAGGAYEAICGAVLCSIKKIKHLCVLKVPGSAKPSQQLQIHGLDSRTIASEVKKIMS